MACRVRRLFSGRSYRLFHSSLMENPNIKFSPFTRPDICVDYSAMKHSIQRRGLSHDYLSKLDELIALERKMKEVQEEYEKFHSNTQNTSVPTVVFRQRRASHQKDMKSMRLAADAMRLAFPNYLWKGVTADESRDSKYEPLTDQTDDFFQEMSYSSIRDELIERDGLRYLLPKASSIEREIVSTLMKHFIQQAEHPFIPVSLSDIVRAPAVEALHVNLFHQLVSAPTITENQLPYLLLEDVVGNNDLSSLNPYTMEFLCGSASLPSYLAFLLRMQIRMKSLPLRLISRGQRYGLRRSHEGTCCPTHYNQLSLLVATSTEEELLNELDALLRSLIKCYRKFKANPLLRVVEPTSLHLAESHRIDIHWNDSEKVSSICCYNDYLSRKLNIQNTKSNFLYLLWASGYDSHDFFKAFQTLNTLSVPTGDHRII